MPTAPLDQHAPPVASPWAPAEPAPAAPTARRILIIRPSALGDVARTVPALVSLRRAMPDAHIDWLVQESYADVIRHHPDLNDVVIFPRDRFGKKLWLPANLRSAWHWCRDLAHRRYDYVIDLQGLFRSGLFAWLTHAPTRVGFANARELAWLGYTHRHHVDASMHTVDRMLAVLQAQGLELHHDMRLYVAPDDQHWLDAYLDQHSRAGEPFATLAPTARWQSKCWPIDRYVQIAKRLLDAGRTGSRILILAAPSERPYIQPLMQALGDRALFPHTTVGQMMAVLSQTLLLIANDSAALHVAVGFDRPLVAVFGPTDPAVVGPYRRPETVVRPAGVPKLTAHDYRRHRRDQSLIAQVTVDQVWASVQQQLAAAS